MTRRQSLWVSCARFHPNQVCELTEHPAGRHAQNFGIFQAYPPPPSPRPSPPIWHKKPEEQPTTEAERQTVPPHLPETSRTPLLRPAAATPPPEGRRVSSPPHRGRQHRQRLPPPRRREGSRWSGSSRLREHKQQPPRLVASLSHSRAAPTRLFCGSGSVIGVGAARQGFSG